MYLYVRAGEHALTCTRTLVPGFSQLLKEPWVEATGAPPFHCLTVTLLTLK